MVETCVLQELQNAGRFLGMCVGHLNSLNAIKASTIHCLSVVRYVGMVETRSACNRNWRTQVNSLACVSDI